MFEYGGIISYIILFCSIAAFGVVVERYVYFFRNESKYKKNIVKHILEYVAKDEKENASNYCKKYRNSNSEILKILLNEHKVCNMNGCNYAYLEEKAREFALESCLKLEKNLWILGVVANLAPLLGLYGTVSGMIEAFEVISSAGAGNAKLLAGGISKALFTTAAGLAVAMPTAFFYNYFNKKTEEIITRLEKNSVEFINFLRKRG